MKKFTMMLPLVALVAACAQAPSAIAPTPMGSAYAGVSCKEARNALNAERQNLAALSSKQQQAVAGDAVGVFLIGVPVSSLTGADVSGDIATSKGKIIALESRIASC